MVEQLADLRARLGRAAVQLRQLPKLRGQVTRLRRDLDRERARRRAAEQRADEADNARTAKPDTSAERMAAALDSLLARPQITHEAVDAVRRRLFGDQDRE